MCSYQNVVFQFIYKIGMFLCVVPRWDFVHDKPHSFPIFYRFAVLILASMCSAFLVYECYLSFGERFLYVSKVLSGTKVLSVFLWICLCYSIIWNYSNKRWFLILIIISRRKLKNPNLSYNNSMLWKFILDAVLCVIIIGTDIIFFSISWLHTLCTLMLMISVQIYSNVVFNLLMVFKEYFKEISTSLEETEKSLFKSNHLKMLQKNYRENLDICDFFNELTGTMFLLAAASASVQLLHFINMLTLLKADYLTAIFTVISGFASMQYGIIAILACYVVEKEAKKVFRQCYKQLECPELMDGVKNEIIVFAMITKNDLPEFTALGFFNLTRSTVLALLNTTATYLIVLYQFRNE